MTTQHELLSSFEGVRYLVLGTQGESEYCKDMDAVVTEMSGMDCCAVMGFERFASMTYPWPLLNFDASEQAARAWLNAHAHELRHNGDEYVVSEFIREHCSDELDEMAGELQCQNEHDENLTRYFAGAR